jgi:hypothetical protein
MRNAIQNLQATALRNDASRASFQRVLVHSGNTQRRGELIRSLQMARFDMDLIESSQFFDLAYQLAAFNRAIVFLDMPSLREFTAAHIVALRGISHEALFVATSNTPEDSRVPYGCDAVVAFDGKAL